MENKESILKEVSRISTITLEELYGHKIKYESFCREKFKNLYLSFDDYDTSQARKELLIVENSIFNYIDENYPKGITDGGIEYEGSIIMIQDNDAHIWSNLMSTYSDYSLLLSTIRKTLNNYEHRIKKLELK